MPPVLLLEGSVAERRTGDQVERPVRADIAEQSSALTRHMGVQAQVEVVAQEQLSIPVGQVL